MSLLPIVSSKPAYKSGDFVYFAYGSSLDFDAFSEWCNQHGYTMPDLSKATPATLEGYKLVFNVRSRFWGGGTASIEPQEGSKVHGIAIPLPAEARGLVEHKEGAASGLYRALDVQVRTANGEQLQAVAYEASPDRVDPSVAPSGGFIDALIKGARERGLPAEWIEELQRQRG